MNIEISQRSQELINKYRLTCGLEPIDPFAPSMELASLLEWLNDPQIAPELQQEIEFILISIRAELLHDLRVSMPGADDVKEDTTEELSTQDKIKFILLTFAGVLVAACEGFDSIASTMSVFALPSGIIFACGIIFSVLSVIAFCGLDLVILSNSLGVRLSEAHKVLDVYIRQWDEIKHIRKKIASYNLAELSVDELEQFALILAALEQRFAKLAATREQFDQVLNNNSLQFAQLILSGVAASIFFGGGFCAGQTVALYVLSIFMVTVTPASVPVLLFSLLVGVAAFSLYWCVEFPGLKTLINGWLGFTEEKIAVFSDKDAFAKEEKKLAHLKENVSSIARLKQQLGQDSAVKDAPVETKGVPSSSVKAGANIYSFMKPAHPVPVVEELTEEYRHAISSL